MSAPPPTRQQRLEEEVAWLELQLERVRRDRARAPLILWALVLMLPAGYFYGAAGAVIAMVVVLATTGCAFYLGVGHRAEYEGKLERIRAEMERL